MNKTVATSTSPVSLHGVDRENFTFTFYVENVSLILYCRQLCHSTVNLSQSNEIRVDSDYSCSINTSPRDTDTASVTVCTAISYHRQLKFVMLLNSTVCRTATQQN